MIKHAPQHRQNSRDMVVEGGMPWYDEMMSNFAESGKNEDNKQLGAYLPVW